MTIKSCFTSFWLSWPGKCNDSTDNGISIVWCQHWDKWHHMTKKVMLHLISVVLTWEKQWCHCWCCWHYVMLEPMEAHDQKRYVAPQFNCLYLRKSLMPFMMLTSCDTHTSPNSIIQYQHQWHHMMAMSVAIVSRDQKRHVASNFDHLDLRNVMVTLRMLIAICDANTSANGIAWLKKPCYT